MIETGRYHSLFHSPGMSVTKKSILLILVIIVSDQVLKIWVKTNMSLGQETHVLGNWFLLHFTENNGMAFGMDLPGRYGKTILSVFRIIAITAIGVYLAYMLRQNAHKGLIISLSLILAGAVGNILDSAFYGVIFSDSYGRVANLFPPEGGYATFLHGRVVDMLYFPIIKGTLPEWFPVWGNRYIIFFRPVFNIADSSITTGVLTILIWQRKLFSLSHKSTASGVD
jgi:signal peptidase II